METRAAHVAVGAFVLLLVAGIVVFTIWIGKFRQDDVAYYEINFAGNVTGLQVDNTVRYRGIPVGRVDSVQIDPENSNLILVTVEVDESTPVKEDSVASIELQGITGGTYIQISGGTPDGKLAPKTRERPYPRIAAMPSRLEELFEGAPTLLGKLNQLADRLASLLSEDNAQAISGTLKNLEVVTGALADQTGGFSALMDSGAGAAEQMRATSLEFQLLAQDLRSETKGIGGSAQQAIADLQSAANAFGNLAGELQLLIRENRAPIRDFAAYGLYEATQLVTELRLLIASVSRVAAQIERDPARFLLGDRATGFQAQ